MKTHKLFVCLLAFILSACDGRIGPLSPPLDATYRGSMVGLGKVIILRNASNVILYDISVTIKNRDGHQVSNRITDVLKPAETVEIGWMQLRNWKIDPGEDIKVYAKGYAAPYMCSIRE